MLENHRTVHIVDDDEAIRDSVSFMVANSGYPFRVYPAGTDFLRAVTNDTRGCVLLDVRMPDIDGLAVQDQLSQRGVAIPVIMLTGHGDVALAVRALKAGATDFLEKPFKRSVLLAAIALALERSAKADEERVVAADAAARIAALTVRERQVLNGMVAGQPNKLIAFELSIATRTVEVHRAHLMGKLSARSLSDVMRISFAAGLV